MQFEECLLVGGPKDGLRSHTIKGVQEIIFSDEGLRYVRKPSEDDEEAAVFVIDAGITGEGS